MSRSTGWCACLVVLLSSCAWATEFRVGSTVSVAEGEVIEDDLFAAAGSVRIEGQVKGDLFVAGETVRVTGPVEGSVMAAGRQVQVTGDVGGSVRAAGQKVILSGAVSRNGLAAGQTVVLEDAARLGRDLHAAGQAVDLDGTVGGRAGLAGETASVRGQVGDQLYFEGDELLLGPTARVGGDLVYCCAERMELAPGAVILGETRQVAPRARPARPEGKLRIPFLPDVLFFLVVFVSGAVGLAAAPRLFGSAAHAMASRPWWNLLLGLLALIVFPIAAVVVCFTVIGIPLGVLALVAWGAGLMFSGVPVGIFVGRWLATRLNPRLISPYLGLFVGLLVLTVVGFVPYLGTVTRILTVLFGLGVYARATKGVLGEMRQQPA